jgi:hypothetical protein
MLQIDSPEILMDCVAGSILLSIKYNHDLVESMGLFSVHVICYYKAIRLEIYTEWPALLPLAKDSRVVHWGGRRH